MLVTFVDKKSVFWSSKMTVEFLVLILSVLARVNGQWGYENNEEASMQEGDSCQIKTGEPGICRRLSSCGVYYEGLKQKTVKYSFLVRCSFIDAEEVICCPLEETPSPSAPQTGWGILKITTTKPTRRATTTKRTTTTTTTMQPIFVGGKTIRGNEPFIDLSKILSTTTNNPRQNVMLIPQEPSMNSNRQKLPSNLNTGVQNPWAANGNINNNPWPDQRNPQVQERPLIQQNNVRFPIGPNVLPTIANSINFPGQVTQPSLPQPFATDSSLKTEATIMEENNIFKQYEFRGSNDSSVSKGKTGKSSQAVPFNSDVDVFNTINTNSGSSNKLVQFPGQMTMPTPQIFAPNSFSNAMNGNSGKSSPMMVPVDSDVEVFNTINTNSGSSNKLLQFPGQMTMPTPQIFAPNSFSNAMNGNSGKSSQAVPFNSDVDVFNTINTNSGSSNKLVQFPGQMTMPTPQIFAPNSFSNAMDGNSGKSSPMMVPVDSDVEVFNTINANSGSSNKLVQFPGQMALSLPQSFPTNSFTNTKPVIAMQNNIFEQYEFRGSNNSNVGGNSATITGWFTPNSDRSERPTSQGRRRTTTTTTTIKPVILETWMQESLDQVSAVTSRPLPPPPPVVTATPFISTEATPIDSVTTRDAGAGRPSQVACQRYRGVNPAGLTFHILDGVPVEPGAFPHIGGLIFPQGGGADVDNRCGSSLISERYVMTAAHCVNDPLSLPIFVRFGVVVWNSKDEDYPPVDVEIENITLHPEYRSHLRYHDLALIRLRNNMEFTTLIRPACLNTNVEDMDSNTPLVVIGWGVTNVQTRSRSEVLLMTNVTTVPLQECNATHIAYGTSRAYRSGLNEGHYCAFDPELKKDACQSDSGGPLQLVRNKESTIVGIVSFGLSCGSAVPSVYVRVAYYLDWIESIVWPS